jgi:hypothetical protein
MSMFQSGITLPLPSLIPIVSFGLYNRALRLRTKGLIMAEQNFANHTRFVPPFHFFVIPITVINLIWTIVHVIRAGFSAYGVFSILFATAIVLLALFARLFANAVQDRVIRLEEQLRLERLLPADLKPRIPEFTINQLVSLRFASDNELPELARKVLNEKMNQRKAIKQLIKTWRPDYCRA